MWSSHTISASGFGPPRTKSTSRYGCWGTKSHSGFGPLPRIWSPHIHSTVPNPNVIWQGKTRTVSAGISAILCSWSNIIYSAQCPGQCRNSFSWEQNHKYDRGREKSYECIKWKLPSVIWTFFGNQLKCIGFYQWLECQTLFPPGGSNPQRGDQIC